MLGFDETAERNFELKIQNQQLVIVTFSLSFNALTFRNNYPTNGQEFEVSVQKLENVAEIVSTDENFDIFWNQYENFYKSPGSKFVLKLRLGDP